MKLYIQIIYILVIFLKTETLLSDKRFPVSKKIIKMKAVFLNNFIKINYQFINEKN